MTAADTGTTLFGPEALRQLRRQAMTDTPDDEGTVTPMDPNAGGTPASEQVDETADAPEAPEKLSDGDRLNVLAQRLGYPDLDYSEPEE
jgi:hypothetical protein